VGQAGGCISYRPRHSHIAVAELPIAASAAATASTFFLMGGDDEGPLDSAPIYEEIDCTTPTATATRSAPTAWSRWPSWSRRSTTRWAAAH